MALSTIDVNFGDLPDKYSLFDESAIVILPVSYDEMSTWIKGADKGPQAILEASANMEIYDIATDSCIYRRGILSSRSADFFLNLAALGATSERLQFAERLH